MYRTPPQQLNNPCRQRQRSNTAESDVSDQNPTNAFLANAESLSPFRDYRSRIRNTADIRNRRRTNAGLLTIRISDVTATMQGDTMVALTTDNGRHPFTS